MKRLCQCLDLKLISETKFLYTFTCRFFLICCPSWLVVSLIRFNLFKILLFWNGNLISSGSDGQSWPIAAIAFYRANINGNPYSTFVIKELFIWENSSHLGESSHLSEISAEWCISLCRSKSFTWEWIHPTQLRPSLDAGEISLRWDDFLHVNSFCQVTPPRQNFSLS